MLTTTLQLTTVRTNGGKTAVVANLSDGRECFVGISDSIGRKRAMYDVLAGSGATMVETAKTLARLEKVERAIQRRIEREDEIERAIQRHIEREDEAELTDWDTALMEAAAELGIDLSA